MRGRLLGVVCFVLGLGVGVGVVEAKPCPKGTSRIGKKCVIDRWAATPRQPIATPRKLPPPTITLAVLRQPVKIDPALDAKVTVEAKPRPAALYRAAQAYRAAGNRTKALELYDQYLLAAPAGPAAPAVRAQIEKLRGDVPE